MGKITEALKKVADEKIARLEKRESYQYVVKTIEGTKIDEHIVAFHDPSSPVAEQYKIMRTNIQSLKFTKNYKTFMITSAIDSEGKTITALNLAITLAHDLNGKSVLLIDADMRKGKMSRYLGIKAQAGLSDLLQGDANPEDMFVNIGVENFTLLPAGKLSKKPSELLSSNKMEKLLASLKADFDYVLIDTPPVMPLTDACILAPMVDASLLVIQAGRTQRDVVKHACTRLSQARAKIAGYVMTNIEYHLPGYLYRYLNKYETYAYTQYNQKQLANAEEI